jgi:tetratricopeptide (TPR) repeat protein
MSYIQNSQLNLAYSDLTEAISLYSENSQYYYYRAFVLMKLNLIDDAIKDVNKAIELNDEIADYYNLKFSLHSMKKEYIVAEACVVRSIELNPTDYNAYKNLGDMYFQVGAYDAYCNCYKDAISYSAEGAEEPHKELQAKYSKYCNTDQTAYYYVRSLAEFYNKDYDKSNEYLEQGLKINSISPVLHNIKASVLLAKKEYMQAEAEFEKCIKSSYLIPEEIINFYNIPISETDAKNMADSYTAQSHLGISIIKLHEKDYANATTYINKALEIAEKMKVFSGIEYLYIVKSLIYVGNNDLKAADLELSKALRANSGNIISILSIASLEILSSCSYKYELLNFEYEDAIKSPRIVFPEMQLIAGNENKLNDANSFCNKVLESDPKNPYIFMIKAKIAQLLNNDKGREYAGKAKEYGISTAFEELGIEN